jgi:hypothetical protein
MSQGVTFHALESAKKCERMNLTFLSEFPFWEFKSQWALKSSKGDCKGQNSLDWKVLYTIGKLLKLRCLKWACMTHLGSKNISYGQKKGQESNGKFDSWTLKVKNRPDFLMCRWCATYRWKDLDKGYNFSLDIISIEGLKKKLWASKVAGVPISSNLGMTFGWWPCGQA